MKVKIYRCYEVVVEDSEGNTVKSEYCYGDKEEAKELGRRLKEEAKQEELWRDDWDRECIRLLTE